MTRDAWRVVLFDGSIIEADSAERARTLAWASGTPREILAPGEPSRAELLARIESLRKEIEALSRLLA